LAKIISAFIDESGDFGFTGEASKYYLITFVFHDQSIDISKSINKIKDKPVFHAGPIIRREYPFVNVSAEERKKLFQSIFMFTQLLPINSKTFSYNKKEYNEDLLKLKARMTRDIYNFFNDNRELFSDAKLLVYYDNGQHLITNIINSALAITGLDYEFKQKVHPENYRLFQVADFISTVKLLEIKMSTCGLSGSEKIFIDKRSLKNIYLRTIRKKEL
jgi:hypothetical protein